MPDPTCPGCRELERRVQELEAQVRELLAKLNTKASNSSTPPSANPLGADKPVKKKKSKRKRGGQRDHPPHLKQLLTPWQVTRVEVFVPAECSNCQAELPRQAGPNDPEPKRFQTAEVPPIPLEVVEYQAHGRICPCCLHSDRWHVYLQVPAERRQLCWAHLKRDFQKIVDGGGGFASSKKSSPRGMNFKKAKSRGSSCRR